MFQNCGNFWSDHQILQTPPKGPPKVGYVQFTTESDQIRTIAGSERDFYRIVAFLLGDSSYGKLDERIYSELTSDHPIDLTRYQVANGYMGKVGLINSGSSGGMRMQCFFGAEYQFFLARVSRQSPIHQHIVKYKSMTTQKQNVDIKH